ncbi:hypothetical protein RhiirA1_467600 [Rhizophagus irregularis]|uniref:Uncharacterized protein n=1 Tax=Rhizophagus irregularis TaxID=588596 RepID=A0A2N0RBR8_9GLOM|nr:hypothetical protein RhiirA1_467600 [Rhizophagus irregularis]
MGIKFSKLKISSSRKFYSSVYCTPSLSFIANFSNLQELKLSFDLEECFVDFEKLQYKFIGGIECCNDNSLNLAISKFCPMLRKLSTGIKNNELESLKIIFNSCKYLESIKIWCGGEFLSEKQALEMVVKYSQNINELILYHIFTVRFNLLPEELESFFLR